jgi:hypothetical protein
MIGKALYGKLSATAAVTALVSTRIFPDMATQDATYPFIVYTNDATQPTDVKDSSSPLDVVTMSVMIYSNSYSQAQDIAAAVRTALDRMTGTIQGVNVQSCRFEGQNSAQMEFDKHVFVIEQSYVFRHVR